MVFDAGGMVEQGSGAVRLGAWCQVVVGYVSFVCFISLYFLIELHGFGRVVLLTQKLVEIWRTWGRDPAVLKKFWDKFDRMVEDAKINAIVRALMIYLERCLICMREKSLGRSAVTVSEADNVS